MTWDLGLQGVALLVGMALAFGLFAQLLTFRWLPRWTWLAATVAYVVSGVVVSEVLFGWATEEDLQPNIDGLSFDEVLLLTTLPGIATVLLLRHHLRHRGAASPRHLAR